MAEAGKYSWEKWYMSSTWDAEAVDLYQSKLILLSIASFRLAGTTKRDPGSTQTNNKLQ